jgi:hypothetical protein
MKDYPQIEMPNSDLSGEIGNRFINEQMNYDKDNQKEEHGKIYNNLNDYKKLHLTQLWSLLIQNRGK